MRLFPDCPLTKGLNQLMLQAIHVAFDSRTSISLSMSSSLSFSDGAFADAGVATCSNARNCSANTADASAKMQFANVQGTISQVQQDLSLPDPNLCMHSHKAGQLVLHPVPSASNVLVDIASETKKPASRNLQEQGTDGVKNSKHRPSSIQHVSFPRPTSVATCMQPVVELT